MPTNNEIFYDTNGMIFVQPLGPGHQTYPLLCHDSDGLDVPLGDVTTALCRTADRGWETVASEQGAPSRATFTIETYLEKTRGWLQKMAGRANKCRIPFYIHWQECAPSNVFNNYVTGTGAHAGVITSRGKSNMVLQRGEEGATPTTTGQSFDISADPEPPDYWKLIESRRDIAEDEPLRDIAFCNYEQCAGPCNGFSWRCEDGIIVADAASGAKADVWFTTDGGAAWAAAATQPFTSDENVCSCVCFHTSTTNTRHVVIRGTTDGANPAEIGYTDDAGATWTNVNVGAVAGEYGMHSGALFAYDYQNMWAVTDQGNVYFSDDSGASWTDLGAACTEELFYVHFIDEHYGWVVGDGNTTLYTTDGGEHFSAPTGPLATADLWCVATLTSKRAYVGGELAGQGYLWLTEDAGATWTDYTDRLVAAEGFDGAKTDITHIGDVMFMDEYHGQVTGCYNDASDDDFKGTWRTVDGGWNWEFYYDSDDALDSAVEQTAGTATWVCDENHGFSVGEVSASTGLIEELTAVGTV